MGEVVKEKTPITYYGVSMVDKSLYTTSQVPQDGFIPYQDKEGRTRYKRSVAGVKGKISYMAFRDTDYGKQFSVILNDGNIAMAINTAFDKPDYHSLLPKLYNVDFNKDVTISFYANKKEVNGEKREYQACFISYEERTPEGKPTGPEWLDISQCPKGVKKLSGQVSYEAKSDWYFEKTQELLKRFYDFKDARKKDSEAKEFIAAGATPPQEYYSQDNLLKENPKAMPPATLFFGPEDQLPF